MSFLSLFALVTQKMPDVEHQERVLGVGFSERKASCNRMECLPHEWLHRTRRAVVQPALQDDSDYGGHDCPSHLRIQIQANPRCCAQNTTYSRCNPRCRSRGSRRADRRCPTCDLHALCLEVATQYVGIVDPHICVPCIAIGIGQMIGPHRAATVNLAQHDDDAVALDHTKAWGVAPKVFVMETQLVSIKICSDHDIVHDEVRRHVPCQRYVRSHGKNSTSFRPFACGVLL